MGFVEAVRTCIGKYASFSGRAARPEFWWFLLAVTLGSFAAGLLDALLFGPQVAVRTTTTVAPDGAVIDEAQVAAYGDGPLSLLFGVATFLPVLAAGWRRLHDVGRTGWWWFATTASALFSVLATGLLARVAPALAGWLFIALIIGTLAVGVTVFVFLVSRGDPEPNRFGPPPAA